MSCGYAHLHIMSFITTKFQEIVFRTCANKKNSRIFHFGQMSKFKKGITLKKIESKFPVNMHMYTFCPS